MEHDAVGHCRSLPTPLSFATSFRLTNGLSCTDRLPRCWWGMLAVAALIGLLATGVGRKFRHGPTTTRACFWCSSRAFSVGPRPFDAAGPVADVDAGHGRVRSASSGTPAHWDSFRYALLP